MAAAPAGKLDTGDQLTYTYSERINLATLLAGWDGTATAVSLRLRDGNLLGLGTTGDSVDVLKGTTAVNLGSVVLNRDFIKKNKTATFNATMTATTTTVAGVARTIVTIQLGSLASGNGLKTADGRHPAVDALRRRDRSDGQQVLGDTGHRVRSDGP